MRNSKNPQIYGYDLLTEEQQKDFDLLYSELMQKDVEGTRVFFLPEPLHKDELSAKGYMEAFGMIAQEAGIYSIAAMDSNKGKYWNLVEINQKWRAVNVHAMAQEKSRDKYLMIANSVMEKYMEAEATYGMSERFACPR